jgi:hypothetical protein
VNSDLYRVIQSSSTILKETDVRSFGAENVNEIFPNPSHFPGDNVVVALYCYRLKGIPY